ncbi:putative site specific integrase [Klebsiella pneumoniae]|uniref:Putative site specific integrase n=1 Tax=Klebsiella pneumoniae TaxID=573 RepID=A0A378FPF3_KLEPN|nr:putative site specific integrase [Klebsiella pneumoniae]
MSLFSPGFLYTRLTMICRFTALSPKINPIRLGMGQSLSLLIEPNRSKSWRFLYRYVGKPKMISPGVYPTINLADARSRRDDAPKTGLGRKEPE